MKMIYNVEDKPAWSKLLVFAFQQVLAIMAATIAVPHIIGLDAQIPAAILGAGVGTIVYLLFTRFKSPVCISSSFAFLVHCLWRLHLVTVESSLVVFWQVWCTSSSPL